MLLESKVSFLRQETDRQKVKKEKKNLETPTDTQKARLKVNTIVCVSV